MQRPASLVEETFPGVPFSTMNAAVAITTHHDGRESQKFHDVLQLTSYTFQTHTNPITMTADTAHHVEATFVTSFERWLQLLLHTRCSS